MSDKKHKGDEFYDQLAPLYHLKVDWQARRRKEFPLFDHLFGGATVTSVCDLGCGDGGHAGEVIERGAKYIGIDSSSRMIKMAKEQYRSTTAAQFIKGDMLDLPHKYDGKFDLVLMLGNTLPHLHTAAELNMLIEGVARILKADGRFVVQTVNPDPIKTQDVFFLPPKLVENRALFVPLYVKRAGYRDFFMTIYSIEQNQLRDRQVLKTRLKFWQAKQIATAAAKHKLSLIETFGDAGLSPYLSESSENMILILRKSSHA